MKIILKGGTLAVLLTCFVVSAASAAPTSAVLSTTGPTAPLPGGQQIQLQAKSVSFKDPYRNTQFSCSASESRYLGMVDNAVVGNPNISTENKQVGTMYSEYFGTQLTAGSTSSQPCDAHGLAGSVFVNCTVARANGSFQTAIESQDQLIGGKRSVSLRFPVILKLSCLDYSGNTTYTKTYVSTLENQASSPVIASAEFSSTAPVRAGTFKVTEQWLTATTGSAPLPYQLRMSATFTLVTKPASGGSPAQVFAWDKGS